MSWAMFLDLPHKTERGSTIRSQAHSAGIKATGSMFVAPNQYYSSFLEINIETSTRTHSGAKLNMGKKAIIIVHHWHVILSATGCGKKLQKMYSGIRCYQQPASCRKGYSVSDDKKWLKEWKKTHKRTHTSTQSHVWSIRIFLTMHTILHLSSILQHYLSFNIHISQGLYTIAGRVIIIIIIIFKKKQW